MASKSVKCQTCGERNLAGASHCARCGEPIAPHAASESAPAADAMSKWPAWLRWILVAPVLTIAATIAVQACAIEGIRSFPSDFGYPIVVSIVIAGSALLAYLLAPSYRKYACFATALTQLLYFSYGATYMVYGVSESASHELRAFLLLFLAVPAAATIVTVVYLGRKHHAVNAPAIRSVFDTLSPAARWTLFVPNASALAGVYGLTCLAVNHLMPRIYSLIAADVDTMVIGTAIFVAVCATVAPFGKRTVAWIVAGVLSAIAVVTIAFEFLVVFKPGFFTSMYTNTYVGAIFFSASITPIAGIAGAIVAALAVAEATAVPRALPQE